MKTLLDHVILVPDGQRCFAGRLLIEDGIIQQIIPQHIPITMEPDWHYFDGNNQYLLPGMIDIHLHGSYGYDFIRNPQEAVNQVAKGLVQEGTTAFLASLTVVDHTKLCSLLEEYSTVQQPEKAACFLGVHSEGPYLSKEYKALMDERWLRDPVLKEWEQMSKAAKHCLKIMTIAPERAGMEQLISAAKEKTTLMIGHTGCTCEEALWALQQGCLGFTHLYNAMSQHYHRCPGAVTAALLHDQAIAELIVDGFHVDKNVVRATWKVLGAKRLVLITDAMLGKGMPDGDYLFSNLYCHKKGSTVQVIKTGRIAGSVITLLDAAKNMMQFCGCTLNDLVQMACVNPAKLAQVSQHKGSLEVGKDADMILVNKDFDLLSTFVHGEQVYQNKN